jgi:hypothetical protein
METSDHPPFLLTGLAFIGAQISSPSPENSPYHPKNVTFARGSRLKTLVSDTQAVV